MTNERGGKTPPVDVEVLGLAKRRLMRVFRLDEPAAQQALQKAATVQKTPVVAVALRVLAASAEDLAGGRILAGLRVTTTQHPGRRLPRRQPPKQPGQNLPRRQGRRKK
jgi:hypothetical protein